MAVYQCERCNAAFKAKPRAKRRYCSLPCAYAGIKAAPREVRFWSRVDKSGDCWIFTGSTDKRGYGRFWNGEKGELAHRYAYRVQIGPIPDGLDVCHKCDNPSCVRGTHLFTGTNAENTKDMMQKGRYRNGEKNPLRGEAHPNCILSWQDVLTIRERRSAGESARAIAESFGVCHQTIRAIAQGLTRVRG